MIKRIYQTKIDSTELNGRQIANKVTTTADKFDYKGVIVKKPWGYEYLLFENNSVAIWILFLKNGAKTSMHCHPRKKTSLFVLDGAVETSSLQGSHSLSCFDCIVIDKAAFHSTFSVSKDGSFIMEIESPPDKADLVRLMDEYGRENKAYETGKELTRDTFEYEYHDFHNDICEERKIIEKVIKKSSVVLHNKEDWESFYNEVKMKKNCTVSFLDTNILNDSGEVEVPFGDLCKGEWLLEQHKRLRPENDVFTALTIH